MNEGQWAAFCDAIQRPEIQADLRFQDNKARVVHRAELRKVLEEVFQTRDAEEWLEVFQKAGLTCGPINTIPDVFAQSQAKDREMILETLHPTAGTVRFPGFPYKLSQTPAQLRLAPPRLGEHTEEVLVQVAGYSSASVDQLRGRGVI